MGLSYIVTIPNAAHATAYAIPVNGRFGSSEIALQIPSSPKWAHDVVMNASLVWNQGQVWFQHTFFPDGSVFTFTESSHANVTINYALPSTCAGFAVGWTDYIFAPSSTTIMSARTYLDPSVFNSEQADNATARQYAFLLALHELGRVLGLGNVIDGNDIMDPLNMPSRVTQPPMLSTLDLYAVHVLASKSTLTSLVIVLNTDQYQLLNAWSFLANLSGEERLVPALKSLNSYDPGRSQIRQSVKPDPPHQSNSVERLTTSDTRNPELLVVIGILLSIGMLLNRRQRRQRGILAGFSHSNLLSTLSTTFTVHNSYVIPPVM